MERFTWTLILIIVVFTLSYIIEADDRFWCPERERTFSYVLFLPRKLAIGMQSSKKLLLKNHYDSLIITVLYKQPAGKPQTSMSAPMTKPIQGPSR